MEILHSVNILIHVLAGILSLFLGFCAIAVIKGGKKHILFGRYFSFLVSIVILTGLIGVFIYQRNTFLLIITLLSGYNCFSGVRVIRLRGKAPESLDYLIPALVLASALYYLYYISTIGMYWAPSVTYSTIIALFLVTGYDLSKIFMPKAFLIKSYIYEHIYKMVSALVALASAFAGTVFPNYTPYSQLLPSVIGLTYIIATFINQAGKSQLSNKIDLCKK